MIGVVLFLTAFVLLRYMSWGSAYPADPKPTPFAARRFLVWGWAGGILLACLGLLFFLATKTLVTALILGSLLGFIYHESSLSVFQKRLRKLHRKIKAANAESPEEEILWRFLAARYPKWSRKKINGILSQHHTLDALIHFITIIEYSHTFKLFGRFTPSVS